MKVLSQICDLILYFVLECNFMRRSVMIVFFSIPIFVDAQVNFGFRAGMNFVNFVTRPYYSGDKKYSGSYLSRLNAGTMVEIPLNDNDNWFIYSGPFYSGKGNKLRSHRLDNPFDTIITYLNYLELPISFGYKFNKEGKNRFISAAGPYVSYGFLGQVVYYNDPVHTKRNLHRNDSWYKRLDIGFAVNAMYEINGRFGMRLDYSSSIFDISRSRYQWKRSNNVFGFSVFWYWKRKEFQE